MDSGDFDHFVQTLAARFSRRSMLRRMAGPAITGPLALGGTTASYAQGKDKSKDKDKGTEKAKGNQSNGNNQDSPGNSGCRGEGHPCEGNQVCCDELTCGPSGPGNAWRCGTGTAGVAPEQTQTQTNQQANQTVVN